jgi:hypothetical protein
VVKKARIDVEIDVSTTNCTGIADFDNLIIGSKDNFVTPNQELSVSNILCASIRYLAKLYRSDVTGIVGYLIVGNDEEKQELQASLVITIYIYIYKK